MFCNKGEMLERTIKGIQSLRVQIWRVFLAVRLDDFNGIFGALKIHPIM